MEKKRGGERNRGPSPPSGYFFFCSRALPFDVNKKYTLDQPYQLPPLFPNNILTPYFERNVHGVSHGRPVPIWPPPLDRCSAPFSFSSTNGWFMPRSQFSFSSLRFLHLPSTSTDTEIGKEDINALPVVPCHPSVLRWPMASLGESGIDIIIGLFWRTQDRPSILLPLVARFSCGARRPWSPVTGGLRCEFFPLSTIAHLIEAPCRALLQMTSLSLFLSS